ncbi:immunoglobulin domain-containing protein, partial [Capnocytophaga leadbetteri]
MERKLKTLTTKFVTRCILVMMLALFSIGGMRAQLPYSPAHFGTGNKATIDGVKVTRELRGDAVDLAPPNTVTSANGYCSTTISPSPQYARIKPTGTDPINMVVYVFNEPVKEVYVDLIGLGRKSNPSKKGRVSFGIFCGSGGTANLRVTDVGNIGCNQGSHNTVSTGNNVAYVEGTGQNNYRVKVASANGQPFSILAVSKPANNITDFVLVELNKVVKDNRFDIALGTEPQSQTVCAGGNSVVLKASATLSTSYSNNKLEYQWQKSTNNGNSWVDITAKKEVISGKQVAFTIGNPTPSQAGLYRVKYMYAYGSDNCVMTKYTEEADVKVNGGEVTELTATPPVLSTNPTTNVTFKIKGTPNAVVTYNYGGSDESATIPSSGVLNVQKTLSEPTLFSIIGISRNSCTSLVGKSIQVTQGCGFLPDPVFSEVASGVPTSAILNGVKVTRKVIRDTRPQFSTTAIYSDGNVENNTDLTPAQNTICGRNQYQRGYVYMDSNRVRTVTYTFDKPITSVEIYLQKFGIAKTGDSYNERAEFSVNNGNISLSEITSCNPSANITITGGKVEAPEGNATNISIKAASTKPFTELTITTDILNKGYGFYIEICPTSIVTLDDSVCPTTPAAQFSRGDDQTSTLNGIQVRRELSPTGTNQYSNGFNTNYCGTNISYPNDLPAMDPTLNKITYTFGKKITSAEVHLISFGDLSDRGADVVTFSVKSGTTTLANPKITNVSACDPTATIISGNRLSSVDDKVTDVVIKVSSAVPFDVLELNDGYSTAGGYYVELCPASIKVPLEEATCSSVPAALFPKGSSQQITLDNGVKVTRALPSGIKYSNNAKYDYCNGTRVSYPNDLPWLQDSKEITYTFDQQVTSAEFYLVAFGINGSGLDKVQFITNAGNASITKVYDCNGNTANVVSNNQLISATERLVGDVAVRVTSSQPFTQIKVKDLASTGNGYFLSLCGSSVYKKPYNNSTQCGPTMPTPMFVGTTTATANGIGVTIDRPAGSELLADLNQNVTSSCQTLYKKGTTWVRNNNTVTYKFSQPVNNVELWLALMAGHQTIPSNRDVAKITTNCAGTPTLTLLSDCMGAAVVSANKIWANGVKGVDVAVKVTSDKPFTELTITDDNSTAFGYYVDLCPASIKKRGTGETDPVTITTQLTATTTACIGTSTTLAAKATLAANFSGNINYQWQKSTNNGSTWSNISGQTGSIASGANATYSFTPAASDNNTLYRVVYTYTNAGSFCGTMSLTTNATKLVANAVSSVITVNAPAYSNVAVCASATGTTTITAKATLNTGMGGTGVTYQLQYRPTATGTWVDRAIQKHTLVAGGAERILTIENVASNTGYYRVKYTSDASVCGGGESYSNIFKFDALTATNVITINPATYPNKTVCSGSSFTINAQATVATGTIANDGSGNKFAYELQYKANSSANWALYTLPNGGAAQIYSNNTKVGATRTFNISTENIATGGKFRVKYSADITDLCDDITVYSDEFTVTIDELDVTNITATPPVFKQGENTSVSFVIEGTPDAQVTFKVGNGAEQTQTLNAAGKYNVPPQTTNQTLELSVTKVKKGSCEKTYTDKKGRAEATTGACTTKPAVQYPGTAGQGQTTVMNGVTVTRNFSGKPSIYGNSDPGTYCSGTVYHYYTIIHNNDSSRFSNAVTYVFSKPVTSAEVWLMVMSSPAAGSYDEVQLSTNNGNLTFTKVYDCLGGAGAVTLSTSGRVTSKPSQVNDVAIRVTSDKPFTQLTVTDVRAAGGTSGVLVELCPTSIKPATITITTQPTPKAVCEGKNTQFGANVKVSGVPATESIPYEWQQSTNGLTGWVTAVAPAPTGTVLNNGVHTAAMTLTNVPKTNNGLYYRVIFKYTLSGASITATSTVATLTVYSTDTPTVSSTTTLCPTATPNSVSFASYVTPAAGTTLRWYATATATTSSTTAPTIDTNVTTRTAKTAYVRAINSNGCTSGVVTVTLTVNDTTAPTFNAPAALNIVCNSATATAAINTWLGTATATDACGAIATITNDYTAPANLCNVSGGVITVTFVAKDTFGNVLTKTSTIKLDTPPTVNADTFTATTTTGTVV